MAQFQRKQQLFFIAVTWLLLSTAWAQDTPLHNITLQLQWKHQFEFAGFYAAIEQGYYARRGLQVALREYQDGVDVVETVLSGRAQYGIFHSGVVRARLEGKPVKLLANYFKRLPLVILAAPEIRNLTDLRGKRLMISEHEINAPLIKLAFETEHISLDQDVQIVPHTFNADPFLSGAVDAMTAFATNEPFYLEQQGIPFNSIDLSEYMRSLGDEYLFTSDSEAIQHPRRTLDFIEATNEGWHYALEHKAEIVDLILTQYSQRKSREALLYEADKTLDMMLPLPLPLPIGAVYEELIADVAALILRQEEMDEHGYLQDFIFDSSVVMHQIALTPEEQHWVRTHPEILIGTDKSWVPYVLPRADGSIAGIEADLIARINALSGTHIRLVLGDWHDIVAQAQRGELHGLAMSTANPERSAYFLFSDSPYSGHKFIFTREDDLIANMADLAGRKVALLRGHLSNAKLLQRWPDITAVELDSQLALATALLNKEIDAVIASNTFLTLLRDNMLPTVRMAFPVPGSETKARYSIHKDHPELLAIINKALAAIGTEKIQKILIKWGAYRQPWIALSTEERAWLTAHPRITLGVDDRYPPFSYRSSNGQLKGMSLDYVKLIENKLGLQFELEVAPWVEVYPQAIRHEIDGILNLRITSERAQHLLFTEGYRKLAYFGVMIPINAMPFAHLSALQGKRLGVKRHTFQVEYLRKQNLGIELLEFDNVDAALLELSKGNLDGVFDDLPVLQHKVNSMLLSGLKLGWAEQVTGREVAFNIGVRNDAPELASILDKAIRAIDEDEHRRIFTRWASLEEMEQVFLLSAEEKQYLSNTVFKMAQTDEWMPFIFKNANAEFAGIAVDYWKLIAAKLGLRTEIIGEMSFTEMLTAMQAAQLDIIAQTTQTPNRQHYARFSKPYEHFPIAIAARKETPFISNTALLAGQKVAVGRNYSTYHLLKACCANIDFVQVDNTHAALALLESGQVFAAVDILPVLQYQLAQFPAGKIKLAGVTDVNFELRVMVHRQHARLIPLLNRAIVTISEAERQVISKKWMHATIVTQVNYTLLWEIAGILVLIIAIILYWNRKLARSQAALQHSEHFIRATIDTLSEHLCVLDENGTILTVNRAWREFAMANPPVPDNCGIGANYLTVCETATGNNAEEAPQFAASLRAMLRGELDEFILEYPCNAPAEQRWFIAHVNRFIHNDGPLRLLVTHKNITERKQTEARLRASEAHYRAILNTTSEGYWLISLARRTVEVNRALCDMLGYSESEMRDLSPLMFVDEANQAIFSAQMAKIETTLHRNYEVTLRSKCGEAIHTIFNATTLRDKDGKVMGGFAFVTNITARKRAEETLRIFERLVNITPDQMALVNADYTLRLVNDAYAAIFNKSKQQLIGTTVAKLVGEKTFARIVKPYLDRCLRGESVRYQAEFSHQGEARFLDITYIPYRSSDKQIRGIVTSIRDITQFKQVEEQMCKLSRAVEQSHSTIVITDLDARIEYVNPAFTQATGYTKDEVIGQNPRILQSGYQDKAFYQTLWDTLIQGQVWQGELCNQRKNGELYWEFATISPVKNSSGRTTHYVAVKEDISERKYAEECLRASEEKLRTLYELSPIGIALTDMNGHFLEFNDTFANICGYSVQELQKLDYWALTPREYDAQEATQLESLSQRGRYGPYEKEYCRKDGSRVPLRLNGVLVKGQDGQAYVWSLVEDISAQKQYEAELFQAKEAAEAANRAKSAFLANMSHELRTPLNAILGFAQILVQSPQLPDKPKQQVNNIYQGGQHLLTLINDILDLAKVEAGRIELFPKELHIQPFFRELEQMFRAHAKQKGIDFTYQADSILPISIHADSTRLRQVLVNLLGNAVKFTEQGHVSLRVGYGNGTLSICVEDTGPGIASEQHEEIFKAFSQTGENRYKTQGTGLGLAITRQIIKLMGGSIKLTSELGKGSRFKVNIPVAAVVESNDKQVSMPEEEIIGYRVINPSVDAIQAVPQQLKILIVDDTTDNREVLRLILQALHFEIKESDSGEACLQCVSTFKPHLVLMDLRMPGLSGLETTQKLHAVPELAQTPVIALSASAYQEDQENSYAAGCIDYLSKPVDKGLLLKTLQKYLPLQWEYAPITELTVPFNQANLISKEQRHTLLGMVQHGAIVEIMKYLEKLTKMPECPSEAHELLALAKGFNLKELRRRLQTHFNCQ